MHAVERRRGDAMYVFQGGEVLLEMTEDSKMPVNIVQMIYYFMKLE